MKIIILDLFDIPLFNDKHESYYLSNLIIPINCKYKLYLQPYYSNSLYHKRDIFNKDHFTYLISGKYTYKSISHKKYNTGICYNPNLGKGSIIDNEIIPVKVDKFNVLEYKFYISRVKIYTNQKYNLEFNKKIKITINEFTSNVKKIIIECILISIIDKSIYIEYEFLCKNSPIFDKNNTYFLHCSDLIKLNHIDKYNNIEFTCKVI